MRDERRRAVENLPVEPVLELVDVPAVFEVRVLGDLVDVVHAAGRDLLSEQLPHRVRPGKVLLPIGENRIGLHLLQVRKPRHDHAQALVVQDLVLQVGTCLAHRPPDPVPEAVVPASDHEVAVLAGVDGVDIDREVPVAVAGPDAPVEPVPGPVVIQDPDDSFRRRALDELALARDLVAIDERG